MNSDFDDHFCVIRNCVMDEGYLFIYLDSNCLKQF